MRTLTKTSFDNPALPLSTREVDRRILVVHDLDSERNEIADALSQSYVCTTAASVREALAHLAIDEYALVIWNPSVPGTDNKTLPAYVREMYPNTAFLFIVGSASEEVCNESRLSIPFTQHSLELSVLQVLKQRSLISCRQTQESLVNANNQLTQRLNELRSAVVETFTQLLKMTDDAAYARSVRVGRNASLMGEAFGLNSDLRESLAVAVLLSEFLNQPGKLSFDFLANFSQLRYVADIIRYERENFDGTGNPLGLTGSAIPIASRILRVAREYDAFSDAGNHELIDQRFALCELRELSGSELDPRVVEAFLDVITKSTDASVENWDERRDSIDLSMFEPGTALRVV